jgi:hypothetical protein
MLQLLYTYVASIYPQCFIYFSDVCCKCVYLNVAYVSHICCKCFICMLCTLAMVFKCFFASVFRCMFQVFHVSFRHTLQVFASGCFKSIYSVAHWMCVGSGEGRQRSPRHTGPCVGTWKIGTGRGAECSRAPRKWIGLVHALKYLRQQFQKFSSTISKVCLAFVCHLWLHLHSLNFILAWYKHYVRLKRPARRACSRRSPDFKVQKRTSGPISLPGLGTTWASPVDPSQLDPFIGPSPDVTTWARGVFIRQDWKQVCTFTSLSEMDMVMWTLW